MPREAIGYDLASVYAQRGEPDRAIAELERVIAERDNSVLRFPGDPALDPLHADPRFKALLARLNVP